MTVDIGNGTQVETRESFSLWRDRFHRLVKLQRKVISENQKKKQSELSIHEGSSKQDIAFHMDIVASRK